MGPTTEQIENTPKLTPRQKAILMKEGPFRIYTINEEATKPSERLELIDPARQGTLAAIASGLANLKAAHGGDYVIEDPRTTQILWSTIHLGVSIH